VTCRGEGNYGELGDGQTNSVNFSAPIALPSPATALAGGDRFSCALLAGNQYSCWGRDTWGTLGNGPDSLEAQFFAPAPIALPGPGLASQVSGGSEFSCAVLTDGQVSCWGTNTFGQLGVVLAAGVTFRATAAPVVLPSSGTATKITTGTNHACALLTSGRVACWGANFNGQTGNPGLVPVPTLVNLPGSATATDINAGDSHTCAVLASGAVSCWAHSPSTAHHSVPVSRQRDQQQRSRYAAAMAFLRPHRRAC
jgi:alpha-tubulin suppressor-like RCC1 family protein